MDLAELLTQEGSSLNPNASDPYDLLDELSREFCGILLLLGLCQRNSRGHG